LIFRFENDGIVAFRPTSHTTFLPCPLSSWNLGLTEMTLNKIRSAKASQKSSQKDPEDDNGADNDHPDRGRQFHVRAPKDFFLWKELNLLNQKGQCHLLVYEQLLIAQTPSANRQSSHQCLKLLVKRWWNRPQFSN